MTFGLLIAARGHRDRLRCEWKARRRVCLVVVWCCVRSFGIVLWDFAGFPECFWALSSGRTTARAATKFHEKDLSHTQLRVSAPLNSPLRSQVARSALRRLSLPVFSPFPLLALIMSLVLLCVVFFTRSPLPTPARSASALVFSSARSLVAVVCCSGGGVAVGAWSRLWNRRRRPVVAAVGRRRVALLIFLLELKRRFFPSGFASGRLRSPPVASGRAGELKTFFPYFFWSRIRTEIRDFFWPWPWRISRISVRVSVLAEVGAN